MLQSVDLKIDLNTRQVFKNEHVLQLHSLTYELLAHLIQAAPQTVSAEELLSKVWSGQQVAPETLTQRIALLRKALQETKDNPYIQSVRGKGYRWSHPVKVIHQNQNRMFKLIVAFGVLCLAVGSYFLWVERPSDQVEVALESETSDFDASDELVKQAWHYYRRFDHKNNQIAIDLFNQKLANEPDHIEALIGLSAAYSQATTKFNQEQEVLAIGHTLAQRAVELAPKNAQAWWALAFNLDARGKIQAAMHAYRRAITIAPDELSVKASLAYLLSIDGSLADALALNVQAFKGNAHFRHTQMAQVLSLLQFAEVAESWHQKAVRINPDSIFASVEYAQYLFNEGRLSESKQLINRALANNIKRAELLVILSQIQLLENDLQASLKSIELAQEIAPFNSAVKVWQIWFNSLEKQRDVEQVGIGQVEFEQVEFEQLEPLWAEYTAEVGEEDFWPNNLIHLAMLAIVKQQPEQAAELVFSAYERGFRDVAWLTQTPVFKPVALQPKFIKAIESMQTDIKRQRQIVLDAEWLPQNFLNPKKN